MAWSQKKDKQGRPQVKVETIRESVQWKRPRPRSKTLGNTGFQGRMTWCLRAKALELQPIISILNSSHVWMWELDYKEGWVLNYWCFWTVVLEETLESPLDCREIQPVHPKEKSVLNNHCKDWCWSWNSNTLATWCEELTHLKGPWYWERFKVGEEGDNRGWDS